MRVEGIRRRVVEWLHCALGSHGRVIAAFAQNGVLFTRCVRCGRWCDPSHGWDYGPGERTEALRRGLFFVAADPRGHDLIPLMEDRHAS